LYETITIVGIGVGCLFGVVTLAWVVALLTRRAMTGTGSAAEIPDELGGFQILTKTSSNEVTLRCLTPGSATSSLIFDTAAKGPKGATGDHTGLPAFDLFFRRREAQEAAWSNLRVNRRRLERALAFLRAYRTQFVSIRVEGDDVSFVLRWGHAGRTSNRRLHARHLLGLLPAMIDFCGAVLSAARWPAYQMPASPETSGPEIDRAAETGGATVDDEPWELEDRYPPEAGALQTTRGALQAQLERGRLSPLSRVRRVEDQPWMALAEVDEAYRGDPDGPVEPARDPGPLRRLVTVLLGSRMGTAVLPVSALLAFQLGLFMAAAAANVWVGEASLSWPTARGVVGASQVVTEQGAQGPEHRAHIIYAYAIAAQPYTGRKVRFGGIESDEAKETVARYPKGKDVQVRYAPDDPSVSVLEPGADPWGRSFTWFCVVVLGLVAPVASAALVARISAWRGRRRYGAYPSGAGRLATRASPDDNSTA